MMGPTTGVICVVSTLFGAVLGSFLNVCIWRLPREGLSVFSPPRSHCPSCGAAIAWYDNIPLVSWLVLGGHCRRCHSPISIRYFMVEALTAVLFGFLAYKYLQVGDFRWQEFVALGALSAGLIVASFIDMDHQILPDRITLGGMLLVPFVALLVPRLHTQPVDTVVWHILSSVEPVFESLAGSWPLAKSVSMTVLLGIGAFLLGGVAGLYGFRFYWRFAHPREPKPLRDGTLSAVLFASLAAVSASLVLHPEWTHSPQVTSYTATLLGMATGAGLVLTVKVVGGIIFRKPAMGFGDVKLMGLLGGFAGWSGVIAGFALACLLGSLVGVWRLVRYRTRYLWFGPFLSLGCLLVILFPGALRRALSWYLRLFQ